VGGFLCGLIRRHEPFRRRLSYSMYFYVLWVVFFCGFTMFRIFVRSYAKLCFTTQLSRVGPCGRFLVFCSLHRLAVQSRTFRADTEHVQPLWTDFLSDPRILFHCPRGCHGHYCRYAMNAIVHFHREEFKHTNCLLKTV